MNTHHKKMLADAIKSNDSLSTDELWKEFESFGSETTPKHPKCTEYYNALTGDFDCDYNTKLPCEDCKYGLGKKDPEARCNQL